MGKHIIGKQLTAFEGYLRAEEREPGTIEKYLRDVRAFAAWLDGRALDKETAIAWKGHLIGMGYAPSTINSMLISSAGRICGSKPCAYSAGSSAAGTES